MIWRKIPAYIIWVLFFIFFFSKKKKHPDQFCSLSVTDEKLEKKFFFNRIFFPVLYQMCLIGFKTHTHTLMDNPKPEKMKFQEFRYRPIL